MKNNFNIITYLTFFLLSEGSGAGGLSYVNDSVNYQDQFSIATMNTFISL